MMAGPRRRRTGLLVVAALVVLGAIAAWMLLPPRALGFAGGRVVKLADYNGPTPVGVPAELRSGDLIARGKYLTQAADCEVCHTRDGGQAFAGGRAFKTPFGVLYSPNITADRQSGIGSWTDQDFLHAVHEGVARDGQHLYPAFPYESYTLLTDEDVLAIKAYLFSLPTAQAPSPANSLSFPFNQRWLMGIWATLYSPNARFQPHTDRSPEWNRGAYLAEALAHCGDCHTPRNLGQALDNRHKFGGAVIGGWHAYNITPDAVSGIGTWSDAELADYLATGHAHAHGSAGGPMAEEIAVSTGTLTPGDVHALVAYLRSIPALQTRDLPAVRTDPASEAPKQMQAAANPSGKEIFEGACASCHEWSGVSSLTPFATLTGDRAINDPSGVNVASMVLSGARIATAEGTVLMPAFADAYSDDEIAAVTNYVTARFGAVPSHLTAREVAGLRQAE
jgi:mono/diheme cytochrome c family protein